MARRSMDGRARRAGALGVVIVVVLALALVLAACGSSSTTTSSASPSASATATWTAADLANVQTDSSLMAMLPSNVQSSGEIKCVSDIPYPPWEYFDPVGSQNPAGFDYDLSQALGKKMGVKVLFIDSTFESILFKLKSGEADMAMSAMYDNAERQKAGYSWVDYTFDGTGILVAKGNPKLIAGRDSLAGQAVTVESGATQVVFLQKLNAEFASAGKPTMQIQSVQTQPEALLKVKGGSCVADVTDWSTAVNVAQTTNNGNTFEVVRDPAAPYDPQMNGIGMLTKNTQLVDTVQKALQDLIDDGTYAKIIAKWGFVGVKSATVNAGPSYAASHATP